MVYKPRGSEAARSRVKHAVATGRLPRPSTQICVDCGAPATEYDHRDYNKPLDVEPTCHACNVQRGPGIPKGCNYTHGWGYGIVANERSVRGAVFQVWDFGAAEDAGESLIVLEDADCGLVSADEGGSVHGETDSPFFAQNAHP